MLKRIIFVAFLMLLAELLTRVITMNMIMKVFYIILGLGIVFLVKEELL